jgi:hypothetical protein
VLQVSLHSTSAMSAMPMGMPGMAGIGLLHGIHGQGTDGIGEGNTEKRQHAS